MLEREFQGGSAEAVGTLKKYPALRDECLNALPHLEAAGAPAGDALVQRELERLGVLYGVPWDNDAAMAIALMEYFEIFSEYPTEAILKGCADFKRSPDSSFGFPRPGRLLGFVKPHAERIRMVIYRARRLTEVDPPKPLPKTPEEKAADRQKLIDSGIMDADGNIKPLAFATVIPESNPKGETPAQMADRLRAMEVASKANGDMKPAPDQETPKPEILD